MQIIAKPNPPKQLHEQTRSCLSAANSMDPNLQSAQEELQGITAEALKLCAAEILELQEVIAGLRQKVQDLEKERDLALEESQMLQSRLTALKQQAAVADQQANLLKEIFSGFSG